MAVWMVEMKAERTAAMRENCWAGCSDDSMVEMKDVRKVVQMELYLVVQKDDWKAGRKVEQSEQQWESRRGMRWE